jgi:imidazoleglycerol-phosphate dehydratase
MREARIERKTGETDISVIVNLDGTGKVKSQTGIGFFDHMINSFSTHSGFDIFLEVKGDLNVDCHHTVEDIGIVLGKAIKTALGDRKGINRFSDCFIPMDESLAFCAIDISGRGFCDFKGNFLFKNCGDYETDATPEFFHALAKNAELTLHIKSLNGSNDHHKIEALFKACARCLKEAVKISGLDIPSTKGLI